MSQEITGSTCWAVIGGKITRSTIQRIIGSGITAAAILTNGSVVPLHSIIIK